MSNSVKYYFVYPSVEKWYSEHCCG